MTDSELHRWRHVPGELTFRNGILAAAFMLMLNAAMIHYSRQTPLYRDDPSRTMTQTLQQVATVLNSMTVEFVTSDEKLGAMDHVRVTAHVAGYPAVQGFDRSWPEIRWPR